MVSWGGGRRGGRKWTWEKGEGREGKGGIEEGGRKWKERKGDGTRVNTTRGQTERRKEGRRKRDKDKRAVGVNGYPFSSSLTLFFSFLKKNYRSKNKKGYLSSIHRGGN